jgi:single-strand DNA-binding protein
MARGVNKVIVMGTLGRDPETRYTASNTPITTMSLATNESWVDKVTNERQERTEWHRVKLFGRLAEIASEYLRKGRMAYVEGKLRTEKYTDKDGVERYSTDIIADELQLLGGAPGSAGEERGEPRAERTERAERSERPARSTGGGGNYSAPARREPARATSSAPPASDFDDEIPF